MIHPTVITKSIVKVNGNLHERQQDLLSVEEPLEIRLGFGQENNREQKSIAITMRTPGHDFELALGFLFSEGIIQSKKDFLSIKYCSDSKEEISSNVLRVELHPCIVIDWKRFSRHFYTNSSCGICGKASIESLEGMCPHKIQSNFKLNAEILHSLNDTMHDAQRIFEHTGSLHAAALFNEGGELLFLREDIGRHNALDKVIGASLFDEKIPLKRHILMLSGRTCFELIQKALMANIPIVAAVGAPSSLAAETAENFGITLVGFAKNNRFNIYSSAEKIRYETTHT